MSLDITVPSAGESVTSATLGQWHVKDGDQVGKGDVIATLETDKVSQELEAEAAGVIKLLVEEGEEVDIGAVIGRLEEGSGDTGSDTSAVGAEDKPDQAGDAAPDAADTDADGDDSDDDEGEGEEDGGKAADGEPSRAQENPDDEGTEESAMAEEVGAEEKSSGQATGKSGAPDLTVLQSPRRQKEEAPRQPRAPDDARITRRKMTPLRRKIAAHLVGAQHEAAILTTFNECDMSAVMGMRKELQDGFVAKYGLKLGFMSFFVKAVVNALRAVPQVNGRIDGHEIVQNHYYDIGVAVGTRKGLVVPVLRDADRKSFAEIEQDIADYAQRAQAGKLALEDLQGGVFTISNGGVYGSLLSTPILNPPQSGILGMHTIQQRPVAVDGKVEIRPMMYLALSYDHRLVDGKEAVTFLVRIKESIEQPTRLLVGV